MTKSTGTSSKVIIAMSGGVDSSVAAALLAGNNKEVVGVMFKLWNDPSYENLCCTSDSITSARKVADKIGIPFHVIDAQSQFRQEVIDYFLTSLKNGETPNPCILCNRQVRWNLLMKFAEKVNASHVATGHYARLELDESGKTLLLRGVDKHKDQSYVLHRLSQDNLSHTLLPLGSYKKSEIRKIARKFSLNVSERPDSQDLCFVGEQGYQNYLKRYAPEVLIPGNIISVDGKVLGKHEGLALYTIGQRKGIGISGPEPYYVVEKKVDDNFLIVGTKRDLGKDQATVKQVNWIAGEPEKLAIRASIKIRYKAEETWGWVNPYGENFARIQFDKHLRDITPGQSAVFYQGEICLGGGIII